VRAVINPAARDAQPRNGGGGEFRVGVDLRNLLLQRHATQQVFDAFLDGLIGVEIERRWGRLVLLGAEECGSQSQQEQP